MPNINEIKQSKFLTKEDCGNGVLLTVKECFQENVAKQGADAEMKWCLSFVECEKPMVLNSTNAQIIAGFLGSDETADWVGHKIVLYNEPNISFQGKLTGGIRARKPRNQAPPIPAARALPAEPQPAVTAPPPVPPAMVRQPLPPAPSDNDGGVGEDVPF